MKIDNHQLATTFSILNLINGFIDSYRLLSIMDFIDCTPQATQKPATFKKIEVA